MKKDNPLIISDTEKPLPDDSWSNRKKYRVISLQKFNASENNRLTRISDILPELPYGVVFKEETGMGATTLELKSKRNSIIVEPIKVTASSKAKIHDALYVGSPTIFHNSKVEELDIFTYICNEKIKYKKIIVVADSLSKVINAILIFKLLQEPDAQYLNIVQQLNKLPGLSFEGKFKALKALVAQKYNTSPEKPLDISIINDYFLFIDEIDSFQLDSSYRRSMENCLDYYKLFPEKMRCMLSATDIRFSDPALRNEEITYIKYEVPSKRRIKIITTGRKLLLGKAFDKVVELLKDHPKDKILVAYNSVQGCFNIAENIKSKNLLDEDNIAILCSAQSKDLVNTYFKELDSDILPKRLNFITSAYFTGFDLNEEFHLISISGNTNSIQALSERRLKQIAGRCRRSLKSETILHDISSDAILSSKDTNKSNLDIDKNSMLASSNKKKVEKYKKRVNTDPTREQLIQAANDQVKSVNCMSKHFKGNEILHTLYEGLNEKFLRLLDEMQTRFIRSDLNKNIVISYLNIDAKLEAIRVKNELYLDYDALKRKLRKDGHIVKNLVIKVASELSESTFTSVDRDKKVNEIITHLKTAKTMRDINEILSNDKLTSLQKVIVRDYKRFFSHFDHELFLSKIEETLIGKRDNRAYNSLLLSAQVQTLPDEHIVPNRLMFYFKSGLGYSKAQILKRMNLFLLEIGNSKTISKEIEAIRMLNRFCSTYRKKNKKLGGIFYHVLDYNPQNLICLKKRPGQFTNDKFIGFYLV